MHALALAAVVCLAYVLGSIPVGLLVVRLIAGKDIRSVGSGRTGGTNALRAGGCTAGLSTAILDALKSATAVWVAQWVSPGDHLVHVLAPLAVVLGHNYSMFLPEFNENGRLVRLRGGAGGAAVVGGVLALWPPAAFAIAALAGLVFFSIGIASVATLSIGLAAALAFAVRAAQGQMPWTDVLYPVVAELLLLWALRPNLKRLARGEERIVRYSLAGILRERRAKERKPAGHE